METMELVVIKGTTGWGFLSDSILYVTCEEVSLDAEMMVGVMVSDTEAPQRGMPKTEGSAMAAKGRMMVTIVDIIISCLGYILSTRLLDYEGLC